MEVVNNCIGTVYERCNLDTNGIEVPGSEENGQNVRWKIKYRIKQFPEDLSTLTSVPYLFSPNFEFHLDFHFRKEHFTIVETETQQIYYKIPKDFLPMTWNGTRGKNAIHLICSRFSWLSEKVFRFVNESNLDCYIEISPDPDADGND